MRAVPALTMVALLALSGAAFAIPILSPSDLQPVQDGAQTAESATLSYLGVLGGGLIGAGDQAQALMDGSRALANGVAASERGDLAACPAGEAMPVLAVPWGISVAQPGLPDANPWADSLKAQATADPQGFVGAEASCRVAQAEGSGLPPL